MAKTAPSRISGQKIMGDLRLAAKKGDRAALTLALDQMRTLAHSPKYWEKYLTLLRNPLARLVDMHARRLQLQERLTEQISQEVMESVGAKGVGVIIEAKHLCMMMRGVEKQNSVMITSSVLGDFRSSAATREEFMSLIGTRAA